MFPVLFLRVAPAIALPLVPTLLLRLRFVQARINQINSNG